MNKILRPLAWGLVMSAAATALSVGLIYKFSGAEAREHNLPELGISFQAEDKMELFPEKDFFLRSKPQPPGGTFYFALQAYHGLPATQKSLKQFTGEEATTPGELTLSGRAYPAVTYITGTSHARTAHLRLLIPSRQDSQEGALLSCDVGAYLAPTLKPEDFRRPQLGIVTILNTIRVVSASSP